MFWVLLFDGKTENNLVKPWMVRDFFINLRRNINYRLMNKDGYRLIEKAEGYLNAVLGIRCVMAADGGRMVKLPYYLKAGNRFAECAIEEQPCVFMIPEEQADGTTLAKRASEIGEMTGRQVILLLENIDTVRRRVLIGNRTSFVVPGKQVYLPFMGVLLTERGMANTTETDKQTFSPAAQVLLLWHLQKESFERRNISEIAKQFPYSVKTVSGAAKELKQAGICEIEGDNSGKYLHLIRKDEIWEKAYPWLTSPVQEVMYCNEIDVIPEGLRYVTYDKALAEYTFMADGAGEAYAVYKNDDAIKRLKNGGAFNKVEGRYRIELWKYNPALLAKEGTVDGLSLALCYKDTDDERVIGELNDLVKKICKD